MSKKRVVRRTSLPEEVDARLVKKALKEKRTISNLIRVAIENEVKIK